MVVTGRLFLGDCRAMDELGDRSISLVVTSPPYWHIKDYSVEGQIGHGQSLHEYLTDLYRVWEECLRVLRPGRRLCVNIGDQFARASIYGRYKIIPLHAEVISQCESLGFDFMGSIIWQKRTTMRTSGGATIMGSYPYPPNGLVELDYEHVLLFKKPRDGAERKEKVPKDLKERSKLTKDEWKEYFSGHWRFGGAKQLGHEAMFPEELPRRLIRMFTFAGEWVLDPFVGSGTTMKAAIDLQRIAFGYEINEAYLKVMMEKLGNWFDGIEVIRRPGPLKGLPKVDYRPGIQDARPMIDPTEGWADLPALVKVVSVIDETTLELEDGQMVGLLGIHVDRTEKEEVMNYLNEKVRGKKVIVRPDESVLETGGLLPAYVYLRNKIFINAYLIRSGLARVDETADFSMKKRFSSMARTKVGRP